MKNKPLFYEDVYKIVYRLMRIERNVAGFIQRLMAKLRLK